MDESILSDTTPQISIEIDWEQYFKDFCEAHGKYPVVYSGVLLFPDGYRYSISDYQGPEYAPPSDKKELKTLQLIYWNRRLSIVDKEHKELDTYIRSVEDLQRRKSVPLKQRQVFKNEDDQIVSKSNVIDLTYIRKRLQWLAKDVDECRKMISELRISV